MFENLQAAIPLGFFLSFLIGPVFFVLLETSVLKGFRAGIAFNLGVIIADAVLILIAYFSSYQLLENLSNLPGLYVFGGMILFIYGLVTFIKKPKEISHDTNTINVKKTNYLGLIVKGFLLNFINIGVLVFWLGIVVIIGPNLENDSKLFFLFFGIMILTYFVTDMVKILLAKQLKSKLTPKRILIVKKVLGIMLALSGIILIVKGFLPKDQLNLKEGIEKIRKQ